MEPPESSKPNGASSASNEDTIPESTKKKIEENRFFYSRAKYVFDYAMQEWYEPLEHATLKTEFLRLDQAEINALYATCIDGLYVKASKPSEKPPRTTEEHLQTLSKLEGKIDSAIKTFQGEAFAKLSTRSPKDSVTDKVNDRMRLILEQELTKSDGSPNGDTCAFVQAARKAFKVKSGREVLELFSQSSRIREDLAKLIEFPGAFEIDLIVREWKDIEAALEFRGFVHHKTLTCLSQYCYLQFWPELLTKKDQITQSIQNFFTKSVVEHLPYENCVVDFALLRTADSEDFKFQDTSACLFDWKREVDKKIIHEGPFEFRLVERPEEDPLGCLSLEWRKYIETRNQGRQKSESCVVS